MSNPTRLDVLGIGMGRTGTASLKLALEQLGFGPCHHMLELFQRPGDAALWQARARGEAVSWDALLGGFHSTVDWPSAHFWRELVRDFPDAKVILTVREPEAWYDSISNTIFKALEQPLPQHDDAARGQRMMAKDIIVERAFDDRPLDKAHVLARYAAHNAEVQRTVPAARLLTYNVGQGWEPLCRFLRVPVPDAPFPAVNRRDEFHHGPGRQRD
ncbi:sulfotransferase family protein [Immundisolibacter sp.]